MTDGPVSRLPGSDTATARIAVMQMWQHPFRPISTELAKKLLEDIARMEES